MKTRYKILIAIIVLTLLLLIVGYVIKEVLETALSLADGEASGWIDLLLQSEYTYEEFAAFAASVPLGILEMLAGLF